MPNGEELGRRVLYFYHQIPASNKANGLPIRLSFLFFSFALHFFFLFGSRFSIPLALAL